MRVNLYTNTIFYYLIFLLNNKKEFSIFFTFLPQPNTYEGKLNLFHSHNQTKPYSSYILFQTLKEFINVAETEVESVTNLYSVVVSWYDINYYFEYII